MERNEGAGAVPAKVNDKVHENSMVTTSAASMAELTFADSSITRMGANTQFSFRSKERLVKLEQGTVLIHTPPGNGGATVDCGGVTAAVTGTTFMASHDNSGNVMFVLLEGQGGLKVTVGGSSTVIRPGQAASIGADVKKEVSSQDSSSTPGGDKKTASAGGALAKTDENKGGGEGGGATTKNSSPTPSSGGGEGTASPAPAPAAAPKIQVFDVDVKKVVATTPLIVEFKKELPSVSKIEKVIETQQTKVQDGKLEKTETEVVLIKHEDGDILVGAPKVKAEESVVVNRKEDVLGMGGGGKDSLDVETAAGPGVGGEKPVAAAPPAKVDVPVPPPQPAPNPNSTTVVQDLIKTKPAATDVNLSGVSQISKTYDGTRTVSLVGAFLDRAAQSGVALANIPVALFDSKNAGINIPITVQAQLAGSDAANYRLVLPTGITGTINPRPVSVSGVNAQDKVYDGTGVVTLNGATLQNTVAGDAVSLANVAIGTVNKNVGTGKVVTTGMTLAGADAQNYLLIQQPAVTVNILPRETRVTFDILQKEYDGSKEVSILPTDGIEEYVQNGVRVLRWVPQNLVAGDQVEIGDILARAENAGVGLQKASVKLTLAGTDAVNYSLVQPSNLKVDITARNVTVGGGFNNSKIYDGKSEVAINGAFLENTIVGDDVRLVNADMGLVDDKNVGSRSLRVNMALAGVDAGNYALSQPALFANILARPITITAETKTKVYGAAETALTYQVGGMGLVAGDSITGGLSRSIGNDVGKYAIGLGNLNAGNNYAVTFQGADYEITKAPLTVSAKNLTIKYNGTSFLGGGGVAYSGFVLGENESSLGLIPTYGGSSQGAINAGTYSITPDGLTSKNYSFLYQPGVLTIEKADQNLGFGIISSRLTGSSGGAPVTVSGAQVGTATISVVETDGRASIDSLGNISVGKILGANGFTLRASAAGNENYNGAQQDVVVGITPNSGAITSANPIRQRFTALPDTELQALDSFFYYTGKADGVAGPSAFFQTDYRNTSLDLISLGSPVQLFSAQPRNYYFGGRLEAAQSLTALNLAGQNTLIYANQVSLTGVRATPAAPSVITPTLTGTTIPDGTAAGMFESVSVSQKSDLPFAVRLNMSIDPSSGTDAFLGDFVAYLRHTSADEKTTRTVRLFEHIGATESYPEGSAGTGMSVLLSDWASASIAPQDPAGTLTGTYRPEVPGQWLTLNDLGSFDPEGSWALWVGDTSPGGTGKLTSWSVELEQLLQPSKVIDLAGGTGKTLTMAAGDQGLAVSSAWIKANGANLEFLSTKSLEMNGTQVSGVGSQFLAEAVGAVKMGAQSTPAVPAPSVETIDREQVRILANTTTDANGAIVPSAGSMAVVRTGDSLELRNVTIRGFAEARLEKMNPTTKVAEGRVLISGSAVRDFKIKELVGAAVNADAKIQMAAIDGSGALAGDMVVGGDDAVNRNRLPVQAKIASALAEVGETLPTATAGAMVDAKQIDLAAGNLKFQNANLVAMNAITARANTILVQNSFMTVVRNSGMINMYVSSGLVNQNFGAMVDGRVNFAGLNKFTIGNTVIPIGNQGELTAAYGNALVDINFNNGVPQAGKVNVLKL